MVKCIQSLSKCGPAWAQTGVFIHQITRFCSLVMIESVATNLHSNKKKYTKGQS